MHIRKQPAKIRTNQIENNSSKLQYKGVDDNRQRSKQSKIALLGVVERVEDPWAGW